MSGFIIQINFPEALVERLVDEDPNMRARALTYAHVSLDKAIDRAITKHYPELDEMEEEDGDIYN